MPNTESQPGAVEKTMGFAKKLDVVVGVGAVGSAILFPATAAVAVPLALWSGVTYAGEHAIQKAAEKRRLEGKSGLIFSRTDSRSEAPSLPQRENSGRMFHFGISSDQKRKAA